MHMIDLREYYLTNVEENDYYYQFRSLVENVNVTHNVFDGAREAGNYQFHIFDEDEAIEKFRGLCQPECEPSTVEGQCWFYLVAYYLNIHGYSIKEFPNVLSRPPKDPVAFVYGEIRNRAFSLGLNEGNTIRYATRRQIVSELTFVQKESSVIISETLNKKMELISSRNARFEQMEKDEKLKEIGNLIEYLLKDDGQYIQLDYSEVAFDYVSDAVVKSFRHKVQCFRHSSKESLKERAEVSDAQKDFLIDFGLTLCNLIHRLSE